MLATFILPHKRFDPCVSMEQRCTLNGMMRMNWIWQEYVVDSNKICQYFGDNGERLITRHERNLRDVDAVCEELVENFAQDGMLNDVSSKPVLVATAVLEVFKAISCRNNACTARYDIYPHIHCSSIEL